MSWMLQAYRAPQRTGGKLALLLVALVAALSGLLAGCAPTSTTPTTPTPSLHFVIDNNFMAHTRYLSYALVALGAKDGHVAWRSPLEGPTSTDATEFTSQPVYRNGLVYVGYRYEHAVDPQHVVFHGVVVALEAASGTVRWRLDAGAGTDIVGAPVIDGSTAYVSVSVRQTQGQTPPIASGLVEALDSQTGAVRWKRAVDSAPSMAAPANGLVFVIVGHQLTSHLLALNANDGSLAWDYASDAPLTGSGDGLDIGAYPPLVVGGRVYVEATERPTNGGPNSKALALNASDGSVAWQRQIVGIAAPPVFNQDGDTLCISNFNPLANSSGILGLVASNGAPRWSVAGKPGLVSRCAVSGGAFYVTQGSSGAKTGSVIALNSQDGHQLWRTTTASPVLAAGAIRPTIDNGMVGVYLVGPPATSGPEMTTMAVLRASDGKLLWRSDFSGRPDQPLDMEGDLIFNFEQAANTAQSGYPFADTAYALDSGARLWTYGLGRLSAS